MLSLTYLKTISLCFLCVKFLPTSGDKSWGFHFLHPAVGFGWANGLFMANET